MFDADEMAPADLMALTERMAMVELADDDAAGIIAADLYRETGIDVATTREPRLFEEAAL